MPHAVLAELHPEIVNSKKARSSESWKTDKESHRLFAALLLASRSMCRCLAPSGHGAPASSAVPALVICFWPGGFCWARRMLIPSPAAPLRPEKTAVWHGRTETASRLCHVCLRGWAAGDRDKPLHWSISLQTCNCPLFFFSLSSKQYNIFTKPQASQFTCYIQPHLNSQTLT